MAEIFMLDNTLDSDLYFRSFGSFLRRRLAYFSKRKKDILVAMASIVQACRRDPALEISAVKGAFVQDGTVLCTLSRLESESIERFNRMEETRVALASPKESNNSNFRHLRKI